LISYELAGLHLDYPRRPERQPCVKGTRITVSDVLEYLAGGMDEQAILADFPELRREHIQAVLGFAAERERRLMPVFTGFRMPIVLRVVTQCRSAYPPPIEPIARYRTFETPGKKQARQHPDSRRTLDHQ
jgi:uncharacterized protein (DUF433 family)